MPVEEFKAIVIGAGQGGMPLARALAGAGWKTAIIEREHVGGTCINEGCTPTKTMVASARAAFIAGRGANYGVETGNITVDMQRVKQRKRDVVDSFRGSNERRLSTTPNLELIEGEARFSDYKALDVALKSGGMRQLRAERIFINTGGRPTMPPIPGLESVPALNSTTIMELDEVPEHLIVLGGSYVGLEFGQMFHRFGSRVTVVQRSGRLLGREDADIAEAVADILREDGMQILVNTESLRVSKSEDGGIAFGVKSQGEEKTVYGSHLLVAIGRAPNVESLNLGGTGVELDARGFIKVNEKLETNVPGIYALGDVNGGPAFTHISYDDFRILRTNLLESGNASTRNRMVPYTVFIDPQLGRIGMSEEEARSKGLAVKVGEMPMNYVARALEVDESRGFMKAVVDEENGQILGAAVLGIEGGEIMAMIQIAMMGHLHYSILRDAVFAHPTLAESLNNLFASI